MLAAALAQDGFDKFAPWLNPLLAYFFLIAAAVGTAYAEGQLTADTTGLVTVVTFIFSLAVSGGLHALTPWLKWLSLIQTYFFAIVRATAKGTPAPIATKTTQESVPVQERVLPTLDTRQTFPIPQRPVMPTPIPQTVPAPAFVPQLSPLPQPVPASAYAPIPAISASAYTLPPSAYALPQAALAIPTYTPPDIRQFQVTAGNIPTLPKQ